MWLQGRVPGSQPNLGYLPDSSEIVKSIIPLCMSVTCYLSKAYDSVDRTSLVAILVAIWEIPINWWPSSRSSTLKRDTM